MSKIKSDLINTIRQKYGHLDPNKTFRDPLDFIYCGGSPIDALLYYELFFPEFIEFKECVILRSRLSVIGAKDRLISLVEGYKKQSGGVEQLEKDIASFNFYEVAYVFNDLDCSAKSLDLLADLMAKSWRLKLASEFPQCKFKVVVEPDEDKPGPDVCIYQNLNHIN